MPAGLLLIVPWPLAAWTLSSTEPVGKLDLLPPPPQPQRLMNIEVKQETTARYFGLDIVWHALFAYLWLLDGDD